MRSTKTTNRTPRVGDKVLRYNYRKHSHEDTATAEVKSTEGPAVGGGFYIFLKDDTLTSVENFDEKREEWIEKRPHFTDTPNLQQNAKHEG